MLPMLFNPTNPLRRSRAASKTATSSPFALVSFLHTGLCLSQSTRWHFESQYKTILQTQTSPLFSPHRQHTRFTESVAELAGSGDNVNAKSVAALSTIRGRTPPPTRVREGTAGPSVSYQILNAVKISSLISKESVSTAGVHVFQQGEVECCSPPSRKSEVLTGPGPWP